MNIDKERKDFERACVSYAEATGYDESDPRLDRNGEKYIDTPTQAAWWAWQARAALVTQPAASVEPSDDDIQNVMVEFGSANDDAGTMTYTGDQIVAASRELLTRYAASQASADWIGPVRELLAHIDDILEDDAIFGRIDVQKWNAVSALIGEHELKRTHAAESSQSIPDDSLEGEMR